MPVARKDPEAILDYLWDYTDYLDTGDTIVSARASAQSGITVISEGFTTTGHTVWLVSGTAGNEYQVTSRIYTQAGRRDERTWTFRVEER